MGIVREIPGPGQESVWDYPRPPKLDPVTDHVVVTLGGEVMTPLTFQLRVCVSLFPACPQNWTL
jgi:hypothetical protein